MARPSLHLDRSLLLVFPLLFALLHAAVAPAAGPPLAPTDWPQFRGPGGLGVSPAKGLAAEWSGTKNIVWKTELPGPGASSPIVVGQRIFITAYSGYGLDDREPGDPSKLVYHVLCLERASGRIAWDKTLQPKLPVPPFRGFVALHGYASSTPAADGEALIAFFGNTGVSAWAHDGRTVWQSSVGDKTHNWGSGTSPVLHGNVVIVNAGVESGRLVAFDRNTGRELWSAPGMDMSWNTPLIVAAGAGAQAVVSVKNRLLAFDVGTGAPAWSARGIDDYVCPSLVADAQVVYAIGARKSAAIAVRLGGTGDVTGSHAAWSLDRGSNVSSPALADGLLYWADEKGRRVFCASAADGKLVYEQDLEPAADRIYASPLVADGKVFYLSRTGAAYVIEAGRSYKLLSRNSIPSDTSIFNASPVPLAEEGRLLLRSNRALYCIGTRH